MATAIARFANYGVDYLTCTFGSQAHMTALEFYLTRVERQQVKAGGLRRSWSMSGYSGFRVGGLEFGAREDGVIVRLSGNTAAEHWVRVGELSTNCSRIDVQTTVYYDEPPATTARRHLKEATQLWTSKKKFPKPVAWVDPAGVQAIYSGSRHSSHYFRFYHRFSKEPISEFLGQLRYEVEVKGKIAQLTLANLLDHSRDSEQIPGHCQTMFAARGFRLQWNKAPEHRLRCPYLKSDVSRRLRWLENGVRPAIAELISLGLVDQVVHALGLSESVKSCGSLNREG